MGPQRHAKGKGGRLAQELEEIAELERRVIDEAPPLGANPLCEGPTAVAGDAAAAAAEGSDDDGGGKAAPSGERPRWARKFVDLAISRRTLDGLKQAGFSRLTDVQRAAIPHALAGRDVLGAAKTGSGKTLAFLVPLLDKLWRLRWGKLDGCGALVVSPTRELALQIFDVLRAVGARHDLSAGMIIGGKDYAQEASRIVQMNILVCTPGRLLQHMDQTVGFELTGLQLLVLDEADRLLDMGFEKTLTAIVRGLPPSRQTLLFSATQTRSVRDLARLSLNRPQYVAVHEGAKSACPERLEHLYMLVPLGAKVDLLWSFLKAHLNAKTIVFASSCKQVRFLHEAFSALRPGVPLMALHGRQVQMKRLGIFTDFGAAKRAVLFATDIAARGLDFKGVDWVLQLDAPEDVATYIHRTGRTARFRAAGKALLLLLPSEAALLPQLQAKKIELRRLTPNPAKQTAIAAKLQALLSERAELKQLAQKAVVAYTRSVLQQRDKEVFDVHALPMEAFAASLGLVGVPRVRFLRSPKPGTNWQREGERDGKGGGSSSGSDSSSDSSGSGSSDTEGEGEGANEEQLGPRGADEGEDEEEARGELVKVRKFRSRNKLLRLLDQQREPGARKQAASTLPCDEEGDELLVVKQVHRPDEGSDEEAGAEGGVESVLRAHDSAASKLLRGLRKGKLKLRHAAALTTKTLFDAEGNPLPQDQQQLGDEDAPRPAGAAVRGARDAAVTALRRRLEASADADKAAERERIREKHRLERRKAKARERGTDDDDGLGGVQLSLPAAEGSDDDDNDEAERVGSGRSGSDGSSSSEEEDEEAAPSPRAAKRREQPVGVTRGQRGQQEERSAKRAKRGGSPAPDSIFELEAAALRMLNSD